MRRRARTSLTRTTPRTPPEPSGQPLRRPAEGVAGLLARSSLLGALPDATRAFLTAHMEPVSLPAGAFLFFQGDPGDAFYLVERGRLRAFRSSTDGRTQTLAYLTAGEVLGELALLDGLERSATVQATEAARLWRLRRDAFLALLREDPDLALALIHLLARRLRESDQKLEDASAGTVPRRLLCALKRLAGIEAAAPNPSQAPLRLRATQDELAGMVGATRESVNRALARLQAQGVVVGRRRGALLIDPCRLEELCPDDR